MTALIAAEIPPLWMDPQLLVGEPDRPVNLVRVGVDAKSPRRHVVAGPRRVLLRQREVLAGVGPVAADQLRRRALVGAGEDSGKLGRLAEDRVRREHEASQVRRDVRAGWRARVVVAVQESLVVHARPHVVLSGVSTTIALAREDRIRGNPQWVFEALA